MIIILDTQISIHALREESDPFQWRSIYPYWDFNPRSPWGERPRGGLDVCRPTMISIHALREESDLWGGEVQTLQTRFQSTLSVRRATTTLLSMMLSTTWFQSTLSVRRATWGGRQCEVLECISIHALREESDAVNLANVNLCHVISIHALREESDPPFCKPLRLPRWISIHALREESDSWFPMELEILRISIHALREESDARSSLHMVCIVAFQSTLSVRRATFEFFYIKTPVNNGFQSTLSVRRATDSLHGAKCKATHFNPRSPWGERLFKRRH